MKSISRRKFVRTTALTTALGPNIIPSHVLGKNAPSNKINVGFIGTGGHGTGWNLPAYLSNDDAKVLVTCDVDTNRMNHAKNIIDQNYGNKDYKIYHYGTSVDRDGLGWVCDNFVS